uniref:replicative DNA helicase n=1 Tax=Eubacterium cellulosolvens TaxID=29322 RepID=UPI0004814EEB|nr:replicative DNA helicase [[Eubacterium] cellulosolvens]
MANDDAVIKRILPHSEAAEQSVIGSMMMDKQAILTASEIVTREDFYQQQYGILFEAMVELYNAGKEVDPVTLQNHLREKKVPKEISDMEYVRDLLKVVPTSANIKHYAEIVAEKAALRRLIHAAEEVTNNCYMDDQPLEQLMEESEKKMFQVFQQKNATDFESIRSIVMKTLDTIEKASHTSGNVTGLATGFTDLDFKTSGMQPSDLILIAARPSMGKTAFVLNIAQYMAFHHGKHVAIFSLEMSKQQLVTRMMSMESHVGSQSLRNGNLKDDEWKQLIETAGVIGESNLIIDDTPGITIREMRSKCRKYKLEHGLDIIMIDYLQLMSGSGGKSSESRQQEISEISRSLKGLARELNVPVIALSQLSRAVESRPDHRPMLSDLRESGAIEQDADVVMFLYRDDYYHKDSENKGICELIIAKQRNGPIGTVNLAWLPEYTKFANVEMRDHPAG